jgi:hypothetical protein
VWGKHGTITVWQKVCFAMRACQDLRDQENFINCVLNQKHRLRSPGKGPLAGKMRSKPIQLGWLL